MSRVVSVVIFSGVTLSLLFTAAALPSSAAIRDLLSAVAAMPAFSAIRHFLSSDYLSVSEVCRRWGERPLDVAAFRSAEKGDATRAAMTCSILKTQDDYIGMHPAEIEVLFGNPVGYYHIESHPAYMIEFAKTRGQDAWQIVFFIDPYGKVSEVFVHKNCCPPPDG